MRKPFSTGFSCPKCGAELTTYDELILIRNGSRAVAGHKDCPTYIVVKSGLQTFDAGAWKPGLEKEE